MTRFCVVLALLCVPITACASLETNTSRMEDTDALGSSVPSQQSVQSDDARHMMLVQSLDELLPALLRAHNAPGVNIALALDGKVVWEAAYGWADVAREIAQSTDTVFHSGSMGKTYTGMAIMQLVERGEISLDDPINKHLPFEVNNTAGGGDILVRHLMTHTSGLGGDGAGSVLGETRDLEVVLEESVSAETQELSGGIPTWTRPVGEMRQYSNLGIALLGLIVERANGAGMSFSEFVQAEIMDPLGMNSTQYPPVQTREQIDPEIWNEMSVGYTPMGNVWIETLPLYFEAYPAGGFVSTPGDHIRFLLALMNDGSFNGAQILKPDTVREVLTPQLEGPMTHYGAPVPGEQQGLVWWLRDWDRPDRAFHHGGGHMFGWRTMSIAWPEYDAALVFAINKWSIPHAASLGRTLEEFVEAWIVGLPPRMPSAAPENIENAAWKTSYLRGLLFVEAYSYTIGAKGTPLPADVQRIAREAQIDTWAKEGAALWDAEAFQRGVSDMAGVAPTRDEIRSFATSKQMAISLEEARVLAPYLQLGPGAMGSLAGLLFEVEDGQ